MITLKKLKISQALSRETVAFTADIYFNGKRVGEAYNEGHGGSTMAALHHVDEFTRARIGGVVKDYFSKKPAAERIPGMETLDEYIDDLVYAEQEKKEAERLYRKTARTVLFVQGGLLRHLVGKVSLEEAAIDQFKRRNPDATVINGMPKDQAIELLLKHVRGQVG